MSNRALEGSLALHPRSVERLVLSSTGPADYGPAWVLVEQLLIGLVKVLPERRVKRILAGGLSRVLTVPVGEEADWRGVLRHTLEDDLTRADVVSHFAVVADLIRRRVTHPQALAAPAVPLSFAIRRRTPGCSTGCSAKGPATPEAVL